MPDDFVTQREADQAYERRQIQREIDLESVGMSSAAATVVVTRTPSLPRDEDERVEREMDAMQGEDLSTFWEDGLVR